MKKLPKDQNVIITQDGKDRRFLVSLDPYGVMVQDVESKISVILDWNGEEVKAVVNDEKSDDPCFVYSYNSRFTLKNWQDEVIKGDTVLGFKKWVEYQKEMAEDDKKS